jgi:hypothetical protein
MKERDASRRSKRSATGAKAVIEPRRLLAAVSLLGASLGLSAAAPSDPISGLERGPQAADPAVKLAETKRRDGSFSVISHIKKPFQYKTKAPNPGSVTSSSKGNKK